MRRGLEGGKEGGREGECLNEGLVKAGRAPRMGERMRGA